jgi:DNA-directed RNA polymerase III subunit RPC1
MEEDERKKYVKKLRNPTTDRRARFVTLKKAVDEAKKKKRCPYCNAVSGKVKKVPNSFKLVHELKSKDAEETRDEWVTEFDFITETNPILKDSVAKASEDLTPLDVLNLFKKIPDQVSLWLWLFVYPFSGCLSSSASSFSVKAIISCSLFPFFFPALVSLPSSGC